MGIKKYFWGLNQRALKETEKIIRDPGHPKFSARAFTLLSRCDKPREVFSLIGKDRFIEAWPRVRKYWQKRPQAQDFRAWWETIYEQLLEAGQKPAGKPAREFQNIGALIKSTRAEKGWSQLDFARRAGMKQPDISAIEKGRKNITLETLIKLSRIVGIKNLPLS